MADFDHISSGRVSLGIGRVWVESAELAMEEEINVSDGYSASAFNWLPERIYWGTTHIRYMFAQSITET